MRTAGILLALAFAISPPPTSAAEMCFEDFVVDSPKLVGQEITVVCDIVLATDTALGCSRGMTHVLIEVATLRNREDLRMALKKCQMLSEDPQCTVKVTGTHTLAKLIGSKQISNATLQWGAKTGTGCN